MTKKFIDKSRAVPVQDQVEAASTTANREGPSHDRPMDQHLSDRKVGSVDVAICAALALLVLTVFGRVASHEFINLDDSTFISQNPMVSPGLTWEGIKWAFSDLSLGNWQPLTWLTHMIDCELFGLNAGAHHAINVLLHTASSLLLFIALKRFTALRWPSAAVAALFALHPLRVESVAWASERKDVLSTLFFMLILLTYERYVRRPSAARLTVVALLLAAGLMSKSMLVTVPFVLLLLDYWPLERLMPWSWGKLRRLIVEKIPLFLLVSVASLITLIAQRRAGAVSAADTLSLLDRTANALTGYARYIGKFFWPSNLAVVYPLDTVGPASAVAAAILLLVVTTLVIRFARSRPYLTVGWLWFLGTLVPVIGLVQVGSQAIADRYTYIPSIGLTIAVVWLVHNMVSSRPALRTPAAAALALILGVLAIRTWTEAGHWKDSVTLFTRAIAVTERNGIAHTNLASALSFRGEWPAAYEHFREALKAGTVRTIPAAATGGAVRYVYPSWYPIAFDGLGVLHLKQGRPEAAATEFKKAVSLRPSDPSFARHLGSALEASGDRAGAMAQYQSSLALRPDSPETKLEMGIAMLNEGKLAEAEPLFDEAIRAMPNSAAARNNRASLYALQGKETIATMEYREALRLDPNLYDVRLNLGAILSRNGELEEANTHFKEAVRIQPGLVEPKIYLGLGMYQGGDKQGAAQTFEAALRVNSTQSESIFCKATRQTCSGHLLSDFAAALRSQP
ncbi:MAG TPA: tetratricopeptide repeat protein [Thermoanaerobaculia bacterium]|nr:tetratricopeptide repeat protein [Thermoanaerobaculia bacterium]